MQIKIINECEWKSTKKWKKIIIKLINCLIPLWNETKDGTIGRLSIKIKEIITKPINIILK
jgi:hypothetical protein